VLLAALSVAALTAMAVLFRVVTVDRGASGRSPIGSAETAPLWEAFPGAFQAPSGATADVVSLVGRTDCFSAVGTVRAGGSSVIASWEAAGDCRTTRAIWPSVAPTAAVDDSLLRVVNADGTDLWHGDALAVVVNPASSTGYLLKGQPDAWVQEELPTNATAVPTAAGPDEPFLLLAGRRGAGIAAWLYSGWDWQVTPLPAPDGAEPLSAAGMPHTTDKFIPPATVIVGHAGRRAVIWRSSAGGRDWHSMELTAASTLTDVVFDGAELIAIGTAPTGGPIVLTSTDGQTWQPDTRALPPHITQPFRALFVLRAPSSGFALGGPQPPLPPVYAVGETESGCAAVYRRDTTAWVAESLGCHGVPTSLLRLRDGRLAAAGGTTLWLRRH
jgi:hypothetical protein